MRSLHLTFLALLALCLMAVAGLASQRPARAAPIPSVQIDQPRVAARADPLAAAYRPGAVLVRFRDQTARAAQVAVYAEMGLRPAGGVPALGIVSLAAPAGREPLVVAVLRGRPEVLFAEPDYRAAAAVAPNDPALGDQWALARINAPAAWSIVTGTAAVTIAVVDSGVTLDHPDLAPKLWTNPDEIPGNRIDDDGNGQVDDMHGWRYYHRWSGSTYVPAEDANVADDYGHGTHVAGIAAAATNNGIGIAGVAWGATVMPVKVLDQYGVGWYSDIAAGIVYAVENGAAVINLSLGGAPASDTLCAAVAYARAAGALVVAAAGNAGAVVFYPAACAGALAVAATDQVDGHPGFSNFGPQVALAAPGVDIYSTWPWVGGYFTKSGTSMAAPHVSGVVALVWTRWPDWSADAVSRQIVGTALDVGEPGWDPQTGWGRLDAAAAVGTIVAPTATPTITPTATDGPSTATATHTPTATDTPAPTATPTATAYVATSTPTRTVTVTATAEPPNRRRYLPFA